MSFSWQTALIDEIRAPIKGSIAIGPFGSRMKSDCYVDSGVRVVRGTNISFGRTFSGDFVFITTEKADELGSANLLPNDLVFPHRGSIGEVGVVPNDDQRYVISSSLMKLTCDESMVLPLFVYYFFKSQIGKFELLKNSSQVGTPGIGQPLASLKSIRIPLPPLTTQAEIAKTLGGLDDRISLFRATNATLEAIAQALFKSWFVDFDPVHAKQEGRTPEGMDDATAALFPDSFEESELGLVPKGWRATKLGLVCNYLSRGISPKYLESGGVLVINQKCIRDFSVDYSKARRHDSAQRKIDGRLLTVGDVLVNSTGVGTLGRVAQVLQLPEVAIVDSHVTVVRAGEQLSWPYLGQVMMRKQPEIEAMGEGSTGQTELSRSKLADVMALVPPASILMLFDRFVIPLKERIAVNESSAKTLAALRDTLLPRLISGQLRLPEAETMLEEASA